MDLNHTVLTGKKRRGAEKMARIPIKVVPTDLVRSSYFADRQYKGEAIPLPRLKK